MNKVSYFIKEITDWFRNHFNGFGGLLAGVGTFLLGIAALIALSQTSSVLENIFKVQEQAKDIKTSVTLLSDAVDQLNTQIMFMVDQKKESEAKNIIEDSEVFKLPDATKEQIERAITVIPSQPTGNNPEVFLPINAVEKTVNMIHGASSKAEKINILKNSLEFNPGFITDPDTGSVITNPDTGHIIIAPQKKEAPKNKQ